MFRPSLLRIRVAISLSYIEGDAPMELNTVQEIERAIDALTPDQRQELYIWLDERYLHEGDAQLKAAIDGGRFDDRITRAVADHKAGRTEPL